MPTYKTPGVYIEEISKFPPSVAEVETAVPAFIGYTERAERRGESLINVPTRIVSLLEYQLLFGGEPPLDSATVSVDKNNNYAVTTVTFPERFYMYEALRLFFDNGGGKCYIVSVGKYSDTGGVASGDESVTTAPGLRVGLKALEKYDEPTIILFPDAAVLADAEFYTLQQLALAQCTRLQDRVAVLDLKEAGQDWKDAVDEFRNGIGINNLKYGAAYTPWLRTAYPREIPFSVFSAPGRVLDATSPGTNAIDLATVTTDPQQNALVRNAQVAQTDLATVNATITTLRGTAPTVKDRYRTLKDALSPLRTDAQNEAAYQAVLQQVRQALVATVAWNTALQNPNLKLDLATYAQSTLKDAVTKQIALEKNPNALTISDLADAAAVNAAYASFDVTGWLGTGATVAAIGPSAAPYPGPSPMARATNIFVDLDAIYQAEKSVVAFITQMLDAALTHARITQNALYERHTIVANIAEAIRKERALVPPSGAVAGVYAFVDRTRGVWKAPANVSLAAIMEPVEQIDFFEQEELNVDVTGGKSINAIRTFTGLGTLVWGARTLAGNDNEWRYVPVRRFFNMVEESVKKSTSWAVFEPNDANLWTKVKSMIDNYLFQKWRDGALAGATPDKAFYVRVGLGETMIAQDILEGRMNVEIGMAVVRPAEFIILKFSHKMQEV
jgi:uncharacterized protein